MGHPQLLTILLVKNFLLTSNINLSPFSLRPFPLVLSVFSLLLINSPQVQGSCNDVSPEPSLSQSEHALLLRPYFIGETLQPSDHVCDPPLEPDPTALCLVLGAQCSTVGFCPENGDKAGRRSLSPSCDKCNRYSFGSKLFCSKQKS